MIKLVQCIILGCVMALAAIAASAQYGNAPEHSTKSQGSQSQGSQAQGGKAQGMADLNSTDKNFLNEAAQGNLGEVELGKLAERKASNDAVKNFGKRMATDHDKAYNELKSDIRQMSVSIPSAPDAKAQAEKDRLSKLSGAEFDKEYMSTMVQDHRKDIAEFQRETSGGSDETLRSYASKTLPTLQEHLRLAEQVNSQVSGSTTSGMR
jgi:putative membrane protein